MGFSYTIFDTDFGWVGIVGSGDGICRIILPRSSLDAVLILLDELLPRASADPLFFGDLPYRIQCYFKGEKVNFTDPLDLRETTPFRKAVWELVRSIPYGKTTTYAWVAEKLGCRKGGRAVGQALAKNPFPILVPCHRVIGSSGELVGFGSGLEMKRRLLALEDSNRG